MLHFIWISLHSFGTVSDKRQTGDSRVQPPTCHIVNTTDKTVLISEPRRIILYETWHQSHNLHLAIHVWTYNTFNNDEYSQAVRPNECCD